MRGYKLDKRIIFNNKGTNVDFKRGGVINVESKFGTTPKYVEIVYTSLPDAIKEHAQEFIYNQGDDKKPGKEFKIVNTNEYLKENLVDKDGVKIDPKDINKRNNNVPNNVPNNVVNEQPKNEEPKNNDKPAGE